MKPHETSSYRLQCENIPFNSKCCHAYKNSNKIKYLYLMTESFRCKSGIVLQFSQIIPIKCPLSTSIPPRYKFLKDLSAHISSVLVKMISYLTHISPFSTKAGHTTNWNCLGVGRKGCGPQRQCPTSKLQWQREEARRHLFT